MRRYYLFICLTITVCAVFTGVVAPTVTSAQSANVKKVYKNLVVGLSIWDVFEWGHAQGVSVKETAEQLGATLKYDGHSFMSQENQIKLFRSFIAMGVDIIGVYPVVESGWERVFREAQECDIPIIFINRQADVPEDLYVTFIGNDWVLEGEKACQELTRLLNGKGNIVELEGTVRSKPADDRKQGFGECLKAYPEITILASQSGEFTRAKGREVMEVFLKKFGTKIDGLYAHNDDMALGAIRAIEDYGLKPGVDIKIVSIDGYRSAFEAMIEGKLNATIETNPLIGPLFFETALKVVNGEAVPKFIPVMPIRVFRQEVAERELPFRNY